MKIIDTLGRKVDLQVGSLVPGMFGDGTDGIVNFDGSTVLGLTPSGGIYTLNRPIFCSDMTVASGKVVNTAGYKIFCSRTLTNNGVIQNVGNPASSGGATGAAGSGGTAVATADVGGDVAGGAGGAGGTTTGSPGNAPAGLYNAAGGAGGAGGTGGTGGVVIDWTASWRRCLPAAAWAARARGVPRRRGRSRRCGRPCSP